MDTMKLETWANLLLDTGKRNNLISFKDTKASTVEIVVPNINSIFEKVESSLSFEVYDPKIVIEEDDDDDLSESAEIKDDNDTTIEEKPKETEKLNREEYISEYAPKLKKNNQILIYNAFVNPVLALKNIDKKARTHLEETGVNVAYIAFGFINWKESEDSSRIYKAPILLAPVSFANKSAIDPWYIQMRDEDVVVNPTFNFKLEAEYGITLPNYDDEFGSLDEYFNSIEKLISKKSWTLSRECKVGVFSFLKLNMYKDLIGNKDKILENNNIRLLLGEAADSQSFSVEGGEHRLANPLIELHSVVDADSSQIEAIELAKAGKSFVLQGPPGTGKSQTITNIISECIYDGKKVLFVSEKQAALNVVYDKLCKAGLEEFCLELHSYKSNKKDVIENLCKTLKAERTRVSQRADQIIQQKSKNQNELDEYDKELHKKREVINKSLYQLYDAFSSCRNIEDYKITINDIGSKGEEYLRKAENLLQQFVDYIDVVGYKYEKNAWYGYKNRDTSYQVIEEQQKLIGDVLAANNSFIQIKQKLVELCGISFTSFYEIKPVREFLELIVSNDTITPCLMDVSLCNMSLEVIEDMSSIAIKMVPQRKEILSEYDEEILKINAAEYNKKLTRQFTSGLGRLFNSEYKQIIADIRINRKNGQKPSYEEAISLTEKIINYNEWIKNFEEDEKKIQGKLGADYSGEDSDWEKIKENITSIKRLLSNGFNTGRISEITFDEYEELKIGFKDIIHDIESVFEESKDKYALLNDNFDTQLFNFKYMSFDYVQRKLGKCIDAIDGLRNWCNFSILLEDIQENDLVSYIDSAIQAEIPQQDIVGAYKKNYYRLWIDLVQNSTPVLSRFNRIAHDRRVEEFKEQDKKQFEISKGQIRAEISAKRPALDLLAQGSNVAVLMREGEKKRKQKSIRKLMEEVGELIQLIKPCFLMSPLSVSTFLADDSTVFDVVVFDEASQIFPQDAVGAIYRGKQLIVVGDSKQMPPSNFFNSTSDIEITEEEVGDITDFESILDMCTAILPQLRLRWHYRSRYEQLISFSNKNFYDNDLITFPSVAQDDKGIGVDYYYVDGQFDRKSKSNRKEAEFIVELIYKNIELYPDRSLGVVAFSVSQQNLIESLLDKKRLSNPSKESFFSKDVAEPFFIKNLETVQGDERDTIIFSVAYAKDSQGRFLHNFGPLNRVGGERRLNVAVTRAKMNVQLVASIHHIDIDLKRTSAEGARLLREYLDFAENGYPALERSITVNEFDEFDSEFEMEVYDFLKANGYELDTQVGCSNFKIDLGLKRPGSSDYVLAIECDGATYHSSKNARDRDRLRQQILESMGWKFYRIWSTDWFNNTSIEKERLLKAAKIAVDYQPVKVVEMPTEENKEEEVVFEEKVQSHFEFPKYKMYPFKAYGIDVLIEVAKALLIESPLSEEWLLKRICWMFNREKVTVAVRREFDYKMLRASHYNIVRKDGFLYRTDAYALEGMRVPEEGSEKREIQYISLEELALGLKAIIEQNVVVEKEGLYKVVVNALGYQKATAKMCERLDCALELLSDQIIIDEKGIALKR